MPAIAEEAGGALKTVYVAFDSKAALLRVLWDQPAATIVTEGSHRP
jgi:AcrR family transcriptional regulator